MIKKTYTVTITYYSGEHVTRQSYRKESHDSARITLLNWLRQTCTIQAEIVRDDDPITYNKAFHGPAYLAWYTNIS